MPIEEARTLAFCTMVTFEWFRAFNARSDERTLCLLGLFRNPDLLASLSVAVLLQLAVVYLPVGQAAFHTVPLSLELWGIALAAAGSLFVVEELRKLVVPRLFSLGKWQPIRATVPHRATECAVRATVRSVARIAVYHHPWYHATAAARRHGHDPHVSEPVDQRRRSHAAGTLRLTGDHPALQGGTHGF